MLMGEVKAWMDYETLGSEVQTGKQAPYAPI